MIIATYRAYTVVEYNRKQVAHQSTVEDSSNFKSSHFRHGLRVATKSTKGKTASVKDVASEVNLSRVDSRYMLSRLPRDYRPQLGEIAYLEELGEDGGLMQVLSISKLAESGSSVILFHCDSIITKNFTEGAKIVFTGKREHSEWNSSRARWYEDDERRTQAPVNPKKGYAGFGLNSQKQGVIVENVIAGLPAHEAGLKSGDRILSINGELIQDASGGANNKFYSEIFEWRRGDKIEIEVQRLNEKHSMSMVLASASDLEKATKIEQYVTPKSDRAGESEIDG